MSTHLKSFGEPISFLAISEVQQLERKIVRLEKALAVAKKGLIVGEQVIGIFVAQYSDTGFRSIYDKELEKVREALAAIKEIEGEK